MQPSLEEVKKLQSQGNVIPVYKSVIADFLTPVSAFLKLEKDRAYAFLLESVEGGEKIGRYTFLGVRPYLIVSARGDEVTLEYPDKRRKAEIIRSSEQSSSIGTAVGQRAGWRMPGRCMGG